MQPTLDFQTANFEYRQRIADADHRRLARSVRNPRAGRTFRFLPSLRRRLASAPSYSTTPAVAQG
ncbi:MAG: hypothetical protein AB8G26_03840 [Ilumatobacter sp.]